ncbi:MAG: alpha/beta fold hydrolase [Actinobacteria bacterium]|nr:alpha/beta fold hydrolase [Actinomycetota bacterium]
MTRPTSARRCLAAAIASALVLSVAACSSDDSSSATTTSSALSTTTVADGGATSVANECDRPPEDAPEVAPVDGVESDHTMTSFDGTEIRFHWFPTDDTGDDGAPVVLMGPGWGQAGDTSAEGAPLFGALGIASMNDRGYHVLTWDPRGFGESTGKAQVNGPDTEGRDVQLLLDWVAAQPDVLLDRDGDPRTGMVGFSYGGGIQLTTAAIDCRVDAIVPGIAWHSLETSLYKSGITKLGWSEFLLRVAEEGRLAPEIVSAGESGRETGVIDQHDQNWFEARGPAELVEDITVPTLIVQGTVDTLFTLDEGVDNFRILDGNDVPVAMVWFCGGHGACLTYDANADTDWLSDVTFAWLDRYVKGDESVDLGPGFRFVDQHGDHWSAPAYPDPVVGEDGVVGLTGSGSGTLTLVAEGGAGPVTEKPASDDILSGIVTGITPAKADHAVNVTITADQEGMVLGAGSLTLTYTGTTPDGERPTRIFAQLVDDETGLVLGNQITPIEVVLDGSDHEVTVPLETVAQRVAPGDTLTLQLVATTVSYAEPRLGGSVDLSGIEITLPLVTSGLVGLAASDA